MQMSVKNFFYRAAGLALVGFLSTAGAQQVRPPVAPIACPTQAVVNSTVCKDESLLQLAGQVELQYFIASIGPHEETRKLRARWQSEYIQCGNLVMQQDAMRACIRDSLQRFSQAMLPMAGTNAARPRAEIFEDAYNSVETDVLIARRERGECVVREVKALDDGVSPARDIATAVARRCRPTVAKLARLLVAQTEFAQPFMTPATGTAHEDTVALTNSFSDPDSLLEDILVLRAQKRAGPGTGTAR